MIWNSDWDQDCLSPHQTSCWAVTPGPLAPAMFPSGVRMLVLEGGEHVLRGNGTSSDLTLRFSAPATWSTTPPPIEWCCSLSKETLAHTGSLALPSPSPSPRLIKVIDASMPWGKTWLVLPSDPALPPKPLGIYRLYRNTPTQRHPFRNEIGDFST